MQLPSSTTYLPNCFLDNIRHVIFANFTFGHALRECLVSILVEDSPLAFIKSIVFENPPHEFQIAEILKPIDFRLPTLPLENQISQILTRDERELQYISSIFTGH